MKMKNMIIMILLFAYFLPLQIVLSNEVTDIESLIKSHFEVIKDANQYMEQSINITDEQLKKSNPDKLLLLLANYDKDISLFARQYAFLYEIRIAKLHPTVEIKQKVSERLIKAIVDSDASVIGSAYEWLFSLEKEDFNEYAKETIRNSLAKSQPDGRMIKICGIADIKEELPLLEELLIEKDNVSYTTKWYYKTSWYARLARARMGIKEDIEECIKLSESVEDLDERVVRIFPDIGYIKQPEIIEYFKKYLESDERMPPLSSIVPGSLYASRVVHILAETLENFPIKQKDARNYMEEEIELCRKWILEQKEWQIKN